MSGRGEIEWQVAEGLVAYPAALADMDARADAIRAGRARERVWLLEHPPLYTAGTSAVAEEMLAPDRFPVFAAGRGGRYTYHGPGQRVGYVQLDLGERGRDVRRYVHSLEDWVVAALAELGVAAWSTPDRIGIWVDDGGREAKIGAIGVRVRRWVTLHGFAINVAPDLAHFSGIVPCGLAGHPVTSLAALGVAGDEAALDAALLRKLPTFLANLSEPQQPA